MKAEMARKLLIEKILDKYSSMMEDLYKEAMAEFRTQRALAINKGSSKFSIYISPNHQMSYDLRYYQSRAIIQFTKEIESMGYKVRPIDKYSGGYYEISF